MGDVSEKLNCQALTIFSTRNFIRTRSGAAGSEGFIERVKALMGLKAIGRRRIEAGKSFRLREPRISYGDDSGAKKSDMGQDNAYYRA
jgi:hypothetical protein